MYDQMKRNSRDVSTFSEGDLPAQGDAPRTHPLHGHAVNISKSHGGGIGTAYATPTRGSYEVRRNGEHIGHYHESNLTKRRHNFAMTTLEPMKCNPTRSMNRGDSFGVQAGASMDPAVKNKKPDEAYFDDSPNSHHDVLVKHGYKLESRMTEAPSHRSYVHPKGQRAETTNYGNGRIVTKHFPGHNSELKSTVHESSEALRKHLIRHHGPAKHSDETGATFSDVPKGVDPEHHKVLTAHGYKHKGNWVGDKSSHTYSHPKGGHVFHRKGISTISGSKIGTTFDPKHSSASDLSKALGEIHGPAKHSDETGAKFAAAPAGVNEDHHNTLVGHGYKHAYSRVIPGFGKHVQHVYTHSVSSSHAVHDPKTGKTHVFTGRGQEHSAHKDHGSLRTALDAVK